MARQCSRCGTDISARYSTARTCLDCYYKWGVFNGARKAYAQVTAAIKKGLLPHPSQCVCADCGKPARDYDHRDYSKPLAVEPVCRRCNKLRGPAIAVPLQQADDRTTARRADDRAMRAPLTQKGA